MLSHSQNIKYNRLSIVLLSLIILIGMFEFLPMKFSLVSLFFLFFFSLFLIIISKDSIPLIWLLLSVLYFFPYENISPLVREVEEYFSIYRRMFGPLNVLEILLGFSIFILIIQKIRSGKLVFGGIPHGPWFVILAFFLFSFLIGFLHIKGNVLSYGHTDHLRPFVAFQAILYMIIIYFITMNSLINKKQILDTISLLKFLTIVLILYGIFKSILIFTGHLSTIWPFGLPIILYNQMTFLYLLIFWGIALLLSTKKERGFSFIWMILAVLFILISTRRFNYFILIAGIFITIIFSKNYYSISYFKVVKKMIVPVSFLLAFVFLFLLIFPSFFDSISRSFESINIYNMNDAETNNDIRRAAINNLFLNLFDRPYTFFTGFGLGTTWKAIVYQPFDTLFKSVNSEFLMDSMGWYPQLPLPYINLIFRYGIIGSMLFWSLCFCLIFRFFRSLKHIQIDILPTGFIVASIVFILLYLTSIGDIYNPTAPILVGFLIGFIERIFELYTSKEIK